MGVMNRNAPPRVLLLIVLSLVGYVSLNTLSSRVMLPSSQAVSTVVQLAFFFNACEGCVRVCGMGVVHIPAPSCAFADIPYLPGSCLPVACFHPVLFFLRRSR